MSDWKIVTLEDVVENINTGLDAIRRAPIVEHKTDLRCLRIQDISQNKPFDRWGYTEVRENDFKKFQLIPDDIIMARTCSTGICYLVKEELPAVFNNGLVRIRLKIDKVYPEFIFYVFKSKHFSGYIDGISGGTSVQLNMKIGDLSKYQFKLPPLSKQKEIAKILSDLDKKIEVNIQTNQTLEQIAQAIFKSWFVDFGPVRAKANSLAQGKTQVEAELAAMQIISGKTPEELTALSQTHPAQYAELAEIAKAFPSEFEEVEGFGEVPRGWEITTLSEICEMQNGYGFKSSDWTENGIPVIKIGSIKPIIVEVEGNGFVSNEYQNLRPDFLLTSGDILVGLTGCVGEVGRIPQGKVAMLNQRVAKFLPKEIDKNHNFYNYIYCLARQKQFKEFAEMNAKGSAQANISTKELLKFPIIKADNECHILFENKIKAILDKILVNSQNSEELASVRDLLLPRLLSGELNE